MTTSPKKSKTPQKNRDLQKNEDKKQQQPPPAKKMWTDKKKISPFNFFFIIARYGLNATETVLKWPTNIKKLLNSTRKPYPPSLIQIRGPPRPLFK